MIKALNVFHYIILPMIAQTRSTLVELTGMGVGTFARA